MLGWEIDPDDFAALEPDRVRDLIRVDGYWMSAAQKHMAAGYFHQLGMGLPLPRVRTLLTRAERARDRTDLPDPDDVDADVPLERRQARRTWRRGCDLEIDGLKSALVTRGVRVPRRGPERFWAEREEVRKRSEAAKAALARQDQARKVEAARFEAAAAERAADPQLRARQLATDLRILSDAELDMIDARHTAPPTAPLAACDVRVHDAEMRRRVDQERRRRRREADGLVRTAAKATWRAGMAALGVVIVVAGVLAFLGFIAANGGR